jgi:hypothetical protein
MNSTPSSYAVGQRGVVDSHFFADVTIWTNTLYFIVIETAVAKEREGEGWMNAWGGGCLKRETLDVPVGTGSSELAGAY